MDLITDNSWGGGWSEPDPSLPLSASVLFARPERVDTHDCTCGDLLATFDRHQPHPDPEARAIREALAHPGAIRSHYQPIVELSAGGIVAHEALLRVEGPQGLVPPGPLFDAAATGGWSQALDQVARRSAIIGAGPWISSRSLFVNFVPSSIYDPAVCLRTTEAAAAEAGVTMGQLVFEVVETERISDIGHLQGIFERYHALGARVALDDVGAGYASLEVASKLEPDVIKIDGAVIRELPANTAARRFVGAAVALAESFDGTVLAEGVEEPVHAEIAAGLGVTLAQGWHFGRPVPAP